MPLITCELRWFFDGGLPGEVERWFCDPRHRLAAAPGREDRYLILPGVADMGVKWRAGRLEIKGRTAVLGTHAIARDIEGVAERWCKWSYDAAAIRGPLGDRLEGDDAIVVAKGRMQRHFLLEPGGPAQEAAVRDLARRGFSFELTRIRLGAAGRDSHWSLGIEAGPDDPDLLADLVREAAGVLDGCPLALPRSRSISYPEWLTRSVRPC